MSANCQTACGIVGGAVTPLAAAPFALAPPRGFGARLAAFGPVATALRKARQFLEALRGFPRRRPGGGEPPEPPEDHQAVASIWDDPLPWMLMMH